MAERFGQRPSQILALDDPWAAYQFDLAVLATAVENEQANRGSQGAPARSTAPFSKNTKDYRNPRALVTRRVRVKPDGTWD